ncbi:hypothetical protein J4234_02700 [Candidatus Woesearchaeota archaeon]|nr:hypothetical protein [Candidatus Woesearchaeota archaeon]
MIDELKEKIKLAQQAVEDVIDPKLKEKAFEVVLNNLISGNNQLVPILQTDSQPIQTQNKVTNDKLYNFLNATNVTEQQITNIFDLDGESIRIIGAIPGNTDSKKQRNATLILLTAKHYIKNEREINVPELKKTLEDLGIRSLVNLSTNLKGFENFIIMKGSKGSKSTSYRITNPGVTQGVELIKGMVA